MASTPVNNDLRSELALHGGPLSNGSRYELLVQSVVDYAIYLLDPDGRIVSWNAGAQRIKGYTSEEVIGKHFSMFYTPEDQAAGTPQHNLDTAATEGRFNGEACRVRKDGTRFHAQVAMDAIHDDAGQLIGFAKVTRDVTERSELMAHLEESERRFRLFAESTPGYALCMLDKHGRVRHWNAGAELLSGYTSEEAMDKPVVRMLLPDERDEQKLHALIEQTLSSGKYEGEHRITRKNGSRFQAQVLLRALKDQAGRLHGLACTVQDLSEKRAMEEALEQTRQQLFQSQKLDALGQLTGGIASDFNGILHSLAGGLEIARMQVARNDTSQLEKRLAEALNLVQRAAQLTQHLMAFARRQPLAPSQVDLNEWVLTLSEMLLRTVGAHIRIDFDLAHTPLPLRCDLNQLESALLNLVLNSRDAMPNGGSLRIITSRVQREDGAAGEWVRLTVKDSGVGMSAEMAGRAFEPFFTTKPLGHGTGLGLSLVHGFVRQSNGSIALHSKVGEGTEVEICLPVADPVDTATLGVDQDPTPHVDQLHGF
ncbi:hybrid sensor histidine kinase/response regulator [Dyella flagellata]|uniref:histidine kinase n=1 Tax=Dyella flagellata TaxID=1867833 RepID=A0ABQ5XF72_9GAMM|nr:PAS domain-containing sensor histidine kinase [Dyella flagellata]GLQ89967.1 histidine kinase [Dyella flagellata]